MLKITNRCVGCEGRGIAPYGTTEDPDPCPLCGGTGKTEVLVVEDAKATVDSSATARGGYHWGGQ